MVSARLMHDEIFHAGKLINKSSQLEMHGNNIVSVSDRAKRTRIYLLHQLYYLRNFLQENHQASSKACQIEKFKLLLFFTYNTIAAGESLLTTIGNIKNKKAQIHSFLPAKKAGNCVTPVHIHLAIFPE